MKTRGIIKAARRLAEPFRVSKGKDFRLKDVDPSDTLDFKDADRPRAKGSSNDWHRRTGPAPGQALRAGQMGRAFDLSSDGCRRKGQAVKNVMSGVNPQGCQVFSFKSPSSEELDHDYFWRCMKSLPNRGHIGIFNRSYYEEVLIVRVHPELLAKQRLPEKLVGKSIWSERFEDIRNFERYLGHNGIVVRKFFLHVSKKEQKRRFLERIDDPSKNWKFYSSDAAEREYWDDYMNAYKEMIRETATKHALWYVVPADNKWLTRVIVGAAIVDALDDLDLAYPKVDASKLKGLAAAKAKLLKK